MKYINLKNFKYQLAESISVFVADLADLCINGHSYIKLENGGWLTVLDGYCWDGATGAPNNPDNMRASLFHDALYELMQQGLLDRKYRDVADRLLEKLCIEDGMSRFWADQFYSFVHAFGQSHILPDKTPKGQIIEI